MMRDDLLICAAVDLDGGDDLAAGWDAIVNTLTVGKAGPVRAAWLDGGGLAARADLTGSAVTHATEPMQPVRSADGSYCLLAGRIFDRAVLCSDLAIDPDAHAAEIYAASFARFGEDCDLRIQGDYAAIQWFPDQRRVRLTRSPTSTAPLHFWREQGRLSAASIPRALFAAGAPRTIDQAKLEDSLLLNGADDTRSWFAGSRRVASATSLWIDKHSENARRYWSVRSVAPVRFARDDDYVDALEEQLNKATRETMRGLEQPGVLLSGGLDSQAVAAFALGEMDRGRVLRSYTSVPMDGWVAPDRPNLFGDESEHVRALAAMYPALKPHFITAANQKIFDYLDELLEIGSWLPVNTVNMPWLHACYAAAAGDGCDALLTGDMGNPGFSYDGLTGYPTWLAKGRWMRLARELAQADDGRSLPRKLASLAVMPHMPNLFHRMLDAIRKRHASPFDSWSPMREDYARQSGALTRMEEGPYGSQWAESASSLDWRDEVITLGEAQAQEVGLALRLQHGIGLRDPTAYRPLLELCIGIPDEQYLRDGEPRWLARRLLKGKIPETVRAERRVGAQSADWILRFRREREALLNALEAMRDDPQLSEMIDIESLERDLREWDGLDDPAGYARQRIKRAVGTALAVALFVDYVATDGD